ncbi:uncharacterized protein LOC126818725 isoform X2 [Patella vulgata]|uniref:uncharacterized protein LOC126818725 isoform X2 n=1 Tax=Patella vulgata TaxID=6465 RepID=UPI0024A909E1|nr:uncharacterized protein LOC126818725 isoform X2 [Patella vulgata]
MDWEHKFSSILGETEENLNRIKSKMRCRHPVGSANRTFDDEFYSTRFSSTPKAVNWETTYGGTSQGADTYALCSKLEQQNKTIDQLSNLVRVMERERDEHKQQIAELRYEVRELSKQVSGKERDKHLQHQITVLKSDISKEVQSIRDQVQHYRNRLDGEKLQHDRTLLPRSYNTDISDIRQVMRDELEYVRTDLDVLRRRLGTLESQVKARTNDGNTEKLHRVMERLSDNRRLLHETREILPDVISDKTLDRCEMEQLRMNVTALKEKLDTVEDKLCHSLSSSASSRSSNRIKLNSTTPTVKVKKTSKFYEDDDDDLVLSEDKFEDSDGLDSDLDNLVEDGAPELTSTRRKKISRKTVDELDLDGLNLSDDINTDISIDSDDDLNDIIDDL